MKLKISALFWMIALLTIAGSAIAQDRRPGTPGDETGRDAVGFRKDSVTKETVGERRAAANTPTTKQAIDDFMQLQRSNKKMQDLAKVQPLAFEDLETTAKDINARASRLKVSLSLPNVKDEKKVELAPANSKDEFMSLVKLLDESVRAFVSNPRFRGTAQSNDKPAATQEKEASENLRKVIDMSKLVQQSAEKLKKNG